MYSIRTKILACIVILLTTFQITAAPVAAQILPALVAKPYPGAVSEFMKNGQPTTCGDNQEAYCFLTRDSIDKVAAFYTQQGIKLETVTAEERSRIGGGISNFEFGLHQISLHDKPGALLVVPLEFYQTKGADDSPSYFNALIIETRKKITPLKADEKGQQAIIDNQALGHFALSPISKVMIPVYGNIFMEPALLIPHYNRHLSLWSGFFRETDGKAAATAKYNELHPTWSLPAASDGIRINTEQDAMRRELKEIFSRKPEKKSEYQALKRSMHNRESREKIQPQLDKILLSDPELAAWKKRSDALEQQEDSNKESNRTLTNEDVEAYLQALENEVYSTRILIHISEGRRVSREPATLQREWGHH